MPRTGIDHSDVRCRYCGETYNLQDVTPTASYADCTMFRTPCCDREVDDREWVSAPAFRRLTDEGPFFVDPSGGMYSMDTHGGRRVVKHR